MSLNTLEQKMINFIKKIEHSSTRIISANTKIVAEAYDYGEHGSLEVVVQVYLHSKLIATYNKVDDDLILYTCGWETSTTKSRLNALLEGLGRVERIKQVKGEWLIFSLESDSSPILFTEAMNF